MSPFDFVLVAYSIVLGLGLTALLSNLAWLVRERAQVCFSKIHAGWVLVTFLWILSAWWDTYSLRARPLWTWTDFILLMAAATFIVFQAFLVTPAPGDQGEDQQIDLKRYWVDHRRSFLGAACCYWSVQFINNLREAGFNSEIPLAAIAGQAVTGYAILGVVMWRRERPVHAVIIVLIVVLHVAARLFTPAGTLENL